MKRIILVLFFLISINSFSQKYTSPFDFTLFLSGTFGELRNNHFHAGIDIKTNEEEGHKLYAISDGYISRIKVSTFGYGKVLYINHPDGNTSVYAHMQRFNDDIEDFVQQKQYQKEHFEIEIFLKENEIQIDQGEIIGFAGNTGFSGGPHLHFEIRNTKTEHPLNPLKFGFDVKDNIDPIITEVILYTDEWNEDSSDKKQNKKKYTSEKLGDTYQLNTNEIIRVSGDTRFGISTFDRQNGAPNNKNGVHSIKLFVDDNLIHHFQVDELSFSEKRFINAHIDYEEYTETNTRFNRCHKLSYNNLSNYIFIKDNGIVNFSDSILHSIMFEVRDIKGNLSVLKFKVQSEIPKNKSTHFPITKEIFKYDQVNIYTANKFEIHMKKYSLYEDCNISYSSSPKINTTLSEIHDIMNESIPAHKEFVISIKEDIPLRLKNKVYIAKIEKNNTFKYKGKTWREEFLSAKTREFGKYCIIADTLPPNISNIKIDKNENMYGGIGSISVKITDRESGISYYRGEIDGSWILMEYEYKKDLLKYHIPSNFKKGNHTITIVVKDRLNNETKIEKEFTY